MFPSRPRKTGDLMDTDTGKTGELSSGPSKYPSMVWVMPRSIPRHVKLHGPVVGHPIQEGSDTTPLAGFETRTRVFSAISPQDAFLNEKHNPFRPT
jgi:hypothetical protein